jgi:hypothetical protein
LSSWLGQSDPESKQIQDSNWGIPEEAISQIIMNAGGFGELVWNMET